MKMLKKYISRIKGLLIIPKSPQFKSTTQYKYINYLMHKNLSDEERARWLKSVFYSQNGYPLNLKDPRSFNEKLNWLKIYYEHPDLARIVDKYAFKGYIEEKLGGGYTVPLLGVWDDEDDIDFDGLPGRFVLKSNCNSDGKNIIIVRDRSKFDVGKTRQAVAEWLQPWNTLNCSFCLAYRTVKPRILAEEYIEQMDGGLTDYKIFCYNGKAETLEVVSDRATNVSINYYDINWNLLPFTRKFKNSTYEIAKPHNLLRMKEIAEKLAEPFPFVRVDIYQIGDKIMIGEMTFYPGGGYATFSPIEWDYRLGEMIALPGKVNTTTAR